MGVCWCRDCRRRSWRASLSRWRGSLLLGLDVQSTARRRSLVVALDERNTLRRKQGDEVPEEKVGHTNWLRQRWNRQVPQSSSLELLRTFVEACCVVSIAYSTETHVSTGASVCSVAELVVTAFVDATETFPGGSCAWQVFIELESKSLGVGSKSVWKLLEFKVQLSNCKPSDRQAGCTAKCHLVAVVGGSRSVEHRVGLTKEVPWQEVTFVVLLAFFQVHDARKKRNGTLGLFSVLVQKKEVGVRDENTRQGANGGFGTFTGLEGFWNLVSTLFGGSKGAPQGNVLVLAGQRRRREQEGGCELRDGEINVAVGGSNSC